jgi:hypothetical protein
MPGIATQQKKPRGQRTGRKGRGQRCHSAGRHRRRKPRPPQLDIEQVDPSETATLPLVVCEDLSRLDDEDVPTQGIALPPLESRLQKRYLIMVQSHLRSAPAWAAGVASFPGTSQAFAATQAAWRFLNNPRVGMPDLVQPLREVGCSRCQQLKSRFALLVHDWCKLSFAYGKSDLTQLTHATDIGYELTTALLVSADDGSPLAPMEMHLKTAGGVISTRYPAPQDVPHLDQVLPTMEASLQWNLDKSLLHVIDREADSVDSFRKWDAAGFKFLVRADDRRVQWSGKSALLSEIRRSLAQRAAFRKVTEDASYHGKAAQLWVAETHVVLNRPAKKNVRGKRFQVAGRPLPLRYVIVQLRDGTGKVLAEWMLLTNASKCVHAEHLARCYYFYCPATV